MTATLQLVTPRLTLREWHPADLLPFAAINADPHVMRYFHAPLTLDETRDAMTRYNAQLDRDGFTMFALEARATGELLGVLGAQTMRFAVPNLPQPAVEIGWRLAACAQGRGLATEGALAILDHLRALNVAREVVAITVPHNTPSRRVMEKLAMTRDPALDFDHPMVPEPSPARRHVLYRREL